MEKARREEDGGVPLMAPFKIPAVEIIDLPLKGEEDFQDTKEVNGEGGRDALPEDGEEVIDEVENDSEWSSIYEDLLNASESEDVSIHGDPDACTHEESLAFRTRLRTIGEGQFIKETIESRTITARRLLTAFNIRAPFFLDGQPDQAYYPLLGAAICRELSKRQKLPQHNTLDDVITLLKSATNIIVLTGAGISTSLGIPDFRSKNTGLYAQLSHLGLSDPQEVFDISLFREDPTIFYSVAKDILPSSTCYSPTHAFIKLLQDKNKLLTNFTQNIDNLETHAGIEPSKLIQCHGSFATATCLECRHQVPCSSIHYDIKAGKVPRCDNCLARIRALQNGVNGSKKRKRSSAGSSKSRKKRSSWSSISDSSSGEDDNIATAGVLKPDITFFGEALPSSFHDRLLEHDRPLVDLVIVIGTSLKVAPVSEVVGIIPPAVPQVYISREPCAHVDFDVDLLGDCDTIVQELARGAGWELRHEMCGGEEVEVGKIDGWESRWAVKVKRSEPAEPAAEMAGKGVENAVGQVKGEAQSITTKVERPSSGVVEAAKKLKREESED